MQSSRGSRVSQSAQGTIKPTAHSTHGPPCPKDRGKVVGTARSFGRSVALEQKGSVTFHDRSKIAAFHSGPTIVSVISGQTLADSSQLQRPWALGAPSVRQRKTALIGRDKADADRC